jgi:hypothetical protein
VVLLLTYVALTGVFANYSGVNDHFNIDHLILKHHLHLYSLKLYNEQNVSHSGRDYNLQVKFILL